MISEDPDVEMTYSSKC